MARRFRIWLVGCTCFALVVALCLTNIPGRISTQLKSDLKSVIVGNDITTIEYEMDGRDVIFTGEVSVNYDRGGLFDSVRKVRGIRNIFDKQSVYEPQPASGQILIENNEVMFSGGFGNSEKLDLIKMLINKFFGDYKIIIEAQASEKIIPMQLSLDFEYLFERFLGNEVWFEFSDRLVVLNGRFRSEHSMILAEQKILEQINRQTGYISDIKITDDADFERIVFEKKAGLVSMSGELSEKVLERRLINLFKGYYPNLRREFDVTINNKLQRMHWYNKLGFLVSELDRLIEGKFKIYEREIVLEGVVDDISTKAGLISRIAESIQELEIIDNLTVRKSVQN